MKTYDAILVLGASLKPEIFKRRVEKAYKLYKQGVAPRVIFSGRHWGGLKIKPKTTEAKLMADYALELGLPRRAIFREERSLNTTGNFYFTWKHILKKHRICNLLVVSHPDHYEKAKFMADKVLGKKYKYHFVFDGKQDPAISNAKSEKLGHFSMQQVKLDFKGVKSGEPLKVAKIIKKSPYYRYYKNV